MVLSGNWFSRRGVIMMAVLKWSLICLALGDGRVEERGEERGENSVETGSKDTVETRVWKDFLTDSPTELEARHNTLVEIASIHDVSIF